VDSAACNRFVDTDNAEILLFDADKQKEEFMRRTINLLAPELFFNFSTPCIKNVKNTGTKYVRIMKQTAF